MGRTEPPPWDAHRPAPPAALYEDEAGTFPRAYRRFLPVLAHFGLLMGVFRVYRIETRVFQDLALLALAALPVHYLTPYRWKKPLFVAVSVFALAWVFGAEVGGAHV